MVNMPEKDRQVKWEKICFSLGSMHQPLLTQAKTQEARIFAMIVVEETLHQLLQKV